MFISAIVDGPTTKFDNKYNAALLMIAPFMTGMLIIVFLIISIPKIFVALFKFPGIMTTSLINKIHKHIFRGKYLGW